MVGELGETGTHAIMGQGMYLGTYYRKPLDERANEYKAHMSKLYLLQTQSTQTEPSQKIIDEAELAKQLSGGWRFVAQLPSGKIIVGKKE